MNNNLTFYHNCLLKIAVKIHNKYSEKYGLDVKTGIWLESAVLKIQKKNWESNSEVKNFKSTIFFSVWLEEKGLRKNRIYYNIHAFKLRHFKGYNIESRNFAEEFRKKFKKFESQFPNVSMNFGPLTLMQGWIELNPSKLENDIYNLTEQFFKIQFIIDDLLEERRV